MKRILLLASALALATPAAAEPPKDLPLANRINAEAYLHSQVAQTAAYLADRIGARLTNSPAMRQAESWTQGQFHAWGLKNVHREGFAFGRGWWADSASIRMTAPRALPLRGVAISWTPGAEAPIRAPIVVAPMASEKDFAAWKGKLAGAIVLVSRPVPPPDELSAPFHRRTDAELKALDTFDLAPPEPNALDLVYQRRTWPLKLDAFLKAEGARAWVRMSPRENSLVQGVGLTYRLGATPQLPAVELAAEDYRRLARLATTGPVELEIETHVHFDDSDPNAYNVLAEIPGRDPKAGYVMAGAHLDSWAAGDGAADNGAGSAIVMEAARILSSLGIKPRRTIRFALWGAEEQGLLGSSAYVEQHLARRPPPTGEKETLLGPVVAYLRYPITPLAEYGALKGYFNLDNGSGRIRGVFAEGNPVVSARFRDWLKPYEPQGVTTVAAGQTGATDHVSLARVGLPAFQFIQDPLDYGAEVHHSNVDTYDHLRINDMRQAAAVMAWTLYQAAEAEEPLEGTGLPTAPSPADPFAEPEPRKP